MMNFAIDFRTFADNALVCHGIFCNILRWNDITLGVDLPEFFIKVELRYDIDQLHIGLPVRSKCSHIFPVAIVFICKQSLSVLFTIRKNMFSKITVALIFQRDQCLFEYRPAKYVNSHGSKITAWFLRFLFKFCHTPCSISYHDAETAGFLHRNRHTGNRDICLVCLMIIQHHFIIHFINMVT